MTKYVGQHLFDGNFEVVRHFSPGLFLGPETGEGSESDVSRFQSKQRSHALGKHTTSCWLQLQIMRGIRTKNQ